MQLLVTGGTGFVMCHVMRQWVERGADYRVTSVDLFPADAALQHFLAPYAEQVQLIEGSVTEQADIVGNPDKRHGAWGAYDTRVCARSAGRLHHWIRRLRVM
jgi:nucleoside-diphosphate-sugar epimerase